MLIKQKEFCRLTGLTRKALLVYEDKKLLLPNKIDKNTGYRFYSQENVERALKISFLRSLSFPIQEIQILVDETESGAHALEKKRTELTQELQRINHGLQFIELNQSYPFPFSDDIRETSLPLYRAATIEGRGELRDIQIHHKLLNQQLINNGIAQCSSPGTYYFKDSTKDEYHFKVFQPICNSLAENCSAYLIEQLGTPRFYFLRHYGSYELLPQKYSSLYTQLKELEIPITGEYMEIYQNRLFTSASSDYTTLITDIGVPSWI